MRRLIVLVGASGSGKTAVAQVLEQRAPWTGHTHHFDSIGVPSAEEMAKYGGGEGWQKWATEKWLEELARKDLPLQLLEGQTRPSFIHPVLDAYPRLRVDTILLDSRPDVRRRRLVALRDQAELASPVMDSWAAYLRGQADALGLRVIDTSDLSVAEVAGEIESFVSRQD